MNSDDIIVVTGSGGFIARRLVARLEASGPRTVAWSRADGDLGDPAVVAERLAAIAPTLIFHLAAVSPLDASQSWTLAASEVGMLSNLALAMPPACRLVYTGSMAEFGYSGDFDESAPCRPNTAYGFAKSSGTDCALALTLTHGLDIRVARLFGVYGPGEVERRLVPHLVSRLARGMPVPLSDGSQVRDFVHVDDVCAALIAIANAPEMRPPLVNVGTGVGVSVRTVCETVADLLEADRSLLRFGEMARRDVDEDRLVARTDRLRALAPVPPQRWLADQGAADYVLGLKARLESAGAQQAGGTA